MRAFYSIYVRRKNGVWQTERKFRRGELPKEGVTVSITLGTEVVMQWQYRLAALKHATLACRATLEPPAAKERGALPYEVHAAEI